MKTLLLAAVFLLLSLAPVSAEESAFATITRVRGDVSLIHGGVETPAQEGVSLKSGDVLQTAGGTADFSMNGIAGCRLLPESVCEIKDPKKSTMLAKLSSGEMVLNLEDLPAGSSFKVQTPTAIASVRGTQFFGKVTGSGTTFSVRDDSIEVFRLAGDVPTGDPVIVEEGRSCDVSFKDAGRLSTRPASGAELTQMDQVAAVRTCS